MRRAAWLFILWQVLWLNIVIPGHTRGAMTLPGGEDGACATDRPAAHSCCPVPDAPADGADEPTPEDQKRCVVCYLVKGYTVSPAVSFDLSLVGRVALAELPFVALVDILDFAFPFYPVGPPQAQPVSHQR